MALCLTPQGYHNIRPGTDIFNNVNLGFWEYILPGYDALGYIACTGTNFALRVNALRWVLREAALAAAVHCRLAACALTAQPATA